MKRIPVLFKDGSPAMPCTYKRAKQLVKQKRAHFMKNRDLGSYLQMDDEASARNTQPISLGIDTGTMFNGFSVVSEKDGGLCNIEFECTRKLKDKNFIKKKSENRRGARRLRRSRLRHRECRNKNRTGHKVTQTENYYFQNIKFCVDLLVKFYPVSHIIIEDVRSVHNNVIKGSSFSPLEQIKTRLYNYCSSKAELVVSKENPKSIRLFKNSRFAISNSTIRTYDMKSKNKAEKSFFSHCLDAHSLACLVFSKHLPYCCSMIYISRARPGDDKVRRDLTKLNLTAYGKNRTLRRPSKLRKIRVKQDNAKSNHGGWAYMYTEQVPTESRRVRNHGGTIKKGKNKYFSTTEGIIRNRKVEIIEDKMAQKHLYNYCQQGGAVAFTHVS